MKRDGIVVAVAVFSLLLQIPAASAQSLKTVYIGLVSITPSNAPVIAAAEGGYFKKQGLDGKPLVMSGSTTALAAMLSGDVGFINVAGSGLINAYLGGRDAVMIAGLVNFAPYDLIVAKGINTIEDLKGKKVGIARFGGSADFLARYGLEKHGIKPGKDVTILQTGGNAERLSAVSQGAIQATLLEQGFAYQAKKAGFRSLLDFSTIGLDYQHSGIATTKSFIAKNRELVTGFLKALIEATNRYKNDRSFGIKVLEKHLRISDLDTLNATYDYYAPKVSAVPYVNLKGMKFLLDTTAESNPKAKNIKPEEIGDNTLLREIEASGFLK
ncbi:MAG: ABC transporter substrate-binding protein [Deltaproteobacteria bacterium]|nr:ABC transporter substrate-binding protein [Deltaproteobacteria bacterium]